MRLFPNLMKLKDYSPKDRMFTSEEEMKMVSDTLMLDKCSEDDLHNYRDLCTSIWVCRYMDTRNDPKKSGEIMNGMMSITSVIDHHLMSMGVEV